VSRLRGSRFGVRRLDVAFKWSGATYVQVVSLETVLGALHPFKAVSSGFAIFQSTALHIAYFFNAEVQGAQRIAKIS